MGKKIFGAIGLLSAKKDQKKAEQQAAAQAAKVRAERAVANDRTQSNLQQDEARNATSRRRKRGTKLFVDDQSTLG